jgi:ABC-type sugar transport system ATPase subunit
MLGLQQLLNRRPSQLSGGQRQRVALGRAIVRNPAVFLLDEPLSNLDAKLRVHMRSELKHLQQQTGITMIFVTHDQAESMSLADRIIVMNRGHIEQDGSPTEIYERPRSRFVSEFVGTINLLEAEVAAVTADGEGAVTLRQGQTQLRCAAGGLALSPGQPVLVSIRPEKLTFHREQVDGGLNVWQGKIATAAYYGDHREYEVDVDDQRLKVTTPVSVAVSQGEQVYVACDPAEMVLMPTTGSARTTSEV